MAWVHARAGAKETSAATLVRYVSTAEVDATYELPATFRVGDFPGLARVEVVRSEAAAGQVRLSWTSSDAFTAHGAAASSALGLPRPTGGGGVIASCREPGSSRRRTTWAWVAAACVLAAWGAVEGLRNHYADWIERPEVEVLGQGAPPVCVLAGRETSFTVRVGNAATLPASRLFVRAVADADASPWIDEVRIDNPRSSRLGPGEHHDLLVHVRAAATPPPRPTVVDVAFRVEGRAGELWGWRRMDAPASVRVSVWPRSAVVERTIVERDATACRVDVAIAVGVACDQGLQCAAKLEPSTRDVELAGVSGDDVAVDQSPRLWGPALLDWRTRPLPAFTIARVQLLLRAPGRGIDVARWDEVVAKALRLEPVAQ